MIASRRGFLFGAGAFLAAPAIVRVSALMPISVPKNNGLWLLSDGAHLGWTVIDRMTTEYEMLGDFNTDSLIIQMQRRIILAKESLREIYATAGQ